MSEPKYQVEIANSIVYLKSNYLDDLENELALTLIKDDSI
jgi:hypothetical protein|tara:strand:+ start:27 stop:146 length:120 start_codon:yes stop_codon:yes gene_type:complete